MGGRFDARPKDATRRVTETGPSYRDEPSPSHRLLHAARGDGMRRYASYSFAVIGLAAWAMHAAPALALELELSAGGTPFLITDNDGEGLNDPDDPNDTNAEAGTIDFVLDGSEVPGLVGHGRVVAGEGAIGRVIQLTSTDPDPFAVLRNTTASPMTLTTTIRSGTFEPVGPPLGWRMFYSGEVADPAPDAVEVTANSATFSVNGANHLATISVPDIDAPGDPPVPFDVAANPTMDPGLAASSSEVIITFVLGPNDEVRFPANPDLEETGVVASLFNKNAKCAFLMNAHSSNIVRFEGRDDLACLRFGTGVGDGDVTSCIDAPGAKGEAAEARQQTLFDKFGCGSPAPPWGVNGASCCDDGDGDGEPCDDDTDCIGGACVPGACIGGAVQSAVAALTHDVFGPAVVAAADIAAGRCQFRLYQILTTAVAKEWRRFATCKKTAFSIIADDAGLAMTCFDPLASDPRSQLAKADDILGAVGEKCQAAGIVPIAAQFAGVCSGAADAAALSTCLLERARCRYCQALNEADDVSPPFDCDGFDNALPDASCTN